MFMFVALQISTGISKDHSVFIFGGPAVVLVWLLYHADADILTLRNVSKNLPIAMASYMTCIHSNHTVWTWKLQVTMGLQLDPVHGHLCTHIVRLNYDSTIKYSNLKCMSA